MGIADLFTLLATLILGFGVAAIVIGIKIGRRLDDVDRGLARIARTLKENLSDRLKEGVVGVGHESGEGVRSTKPSSDDLVDHGSKARNDDRTQCPPPLPASPPAPLPASPPPLPPATRAVARSPEVEDHMAAIVAWVKDDWILKLGALLLFAGLGWFVAYAAWNNWISPQVRILGAIALGVAFSIHGWRGLGKGNKGSATFLVLGTGIIMAATFGGRVRHDLGSPTVALVVMFAAAAVPAMASIRHGIPSLGRLALAAAFVAPLLTSPPSPNWPGLFGALATVVAGFSWVRRRNGDAALQWLAFGGVALYSVSLWSLCPGYWDALDPRHGMLGMARVAEDRKLADSVIPYAYVICALFLWARTASGAGRSHAGGDPDGGGGRRELVALWLVGGLFAAWTGWGISPAGQKFPFWVGALTFIGTGFFASRAGGYRLLLAHWSAAFALAALALHKTMDFPELTGALGALGIAITFGSYLVTKKPRTALLASLSLVPALVGAYYSLSSTEWPNGSWGPDALAILAGAMTSLAGAVFLAKIRGEAGEDGQDLLPGVSHGLALAGAAFLLALAWLVLRALLPGGTGTASCLVLYSVLGIATYYSGTRLQHPCLRKYGTILVLLVAARLLVVEVWAMDTPHRIAAFITVGTILLVTAKFARNWDDGEAEGRGGGEGDKRRE